MLVASALTGAHRDCLIVASFGQEVLVYAVYIINAL